MKTHASKEDGDADIESTVVSISEDKPTPMVNMKPATNISNAAEKFKREHEPNSDEELDRVAEVQNHNAVHPKLRDEIDKKRSTVNVKAVTPRNNRPTTSRQNYDPDCKICQKLKKKHQQRKSAINKKKKRDKRSRVSKNKKPRKNTTTIRKRLTSRGSWHRGTSSGTFVGFMDELKKRDSRRDSVSMNENNESNMGYDGGSDASGTTYRSYESMEHEPMVDG